MTDTTPRKTPREKIAILKSCMTFFYRAKYDFDYEEFDSVSAEAKDFISRLLRKRANDRINSKR